MDMRKFEDNLKKVKEKSNYWISKLVYLNLNIKPKIIIDYDNNEIITESTENIIQENTIKVKSINMLLCDDMMYSGNQMYEHICDTIFNMIEEFPEIQIFNMYLIIPFISSLAFERINNITLDDVQNYRKYQVINITGKSLNINVFNKEKIYPLSHYLTEEEYLSLNKIFGDKMFRKGGMKLIKK